MLFREIKTTVQQQHEISTVKQIVRYPSLPSDNSAGSWKSRRKPFTLTAGDLSAKDESDGNASPCQGCGNLGTEARIASRYKRKKSKAYAQTLGTNATPETHDLITRVTRMLEQGKKTDDMQYIQV